MPRLRSDQIADGQIDSGNITDGTITNADIASNALIEGSKLNLPFRATTTASDLPTSGNSVGDIRYVSDINTFYYWDGSEWKQVALSGSVLSATTSYPLTIGATTTPPTKGTVVEDIATWARRGDKMLWTYKYRQSSVGTTGSGTYLLPIPSGYSIDLIKHPIGSVVGSSKIGNMADGLSASTYLGVVVVYSSTTLAFIAITPTANTPAYWGSTHFQLGTNTVVFASGEAEFTISGWTSNVNLVTDFQEFAFNTQATINTNDTTSFGYGSQGTPIIANTTGPYYYLRWTRSKQPSDLFVVEFRSKIDGMWVDGRSASIPSLQVRRLSDAEDPTNATFVGAFRTPIDALTDKITFSGVLGGSGATFQYKTWAQVVAAADGYDRWRVRKISNGNMAEAPSGIYESGSNANGYYIKYVDGTMIVRGTESALLTTSNSSGIASVYFINTQFTFPVPFADIPVITLKTRTTSAILFTSATFSEQTTGFWATLGAYTSTAQGHLNYTAIGRWNLDRRVVPSGTVVGDDIVCASYVDSTSQATATNGIIQFNTKTEDAYNRVTTGTGWKFTADRPGWYSVDICIYATANNVFMLFKNGVNTQPIADQRYTVSGYVKGSAKVRMNTDDYLQIAAYQANGNVTERYIQITRIGS